MSILINLTNLHNQLSDLCIRMGYSSAYCRNFRILWHIIFLLSHVQNSQESRSEFQLVALTPAGQANINEQYLPLTDKRVSDFRRPDRKELGVMLKLCADCMVVH